MILPSQNLIFHSHNSKKYFLKAILDSKNAYIQGCQFSDFNRKSDFFLFWSFSDFFLFFSGILDFFFRFFFFRLRLVSDFLITLRFENMLITWNGFSITVLKAKLVFYFVFVCARDCDQWIFTGFVRLLAIPGAPGKLLEFRFFLRNLLEISWNLFHLLETSLNFFHLLENSLNFQRSGLLEISLNF